MVQRALSPRLLWTHVVGGADHRARVGGGEGRASGQCDGGSSHCKAFHRSLHFINHWKEYARRALLVSGITVT